MAVMKIHHRHYLLGAAMERVKVDLEPKEYSGLVRLSERELRPVPDQVRFLVREALTGAGLLDERQQQKRGDEHVDFRTTTA
jgi:hypothetical protein